MQERERAKGRTQSWVRMKRVVDGGDKGVNMIKMHCTKFSKLIIHLFVHF